MDLSKKKVLIPLTVYNGKIPIPNPEYLFLLNEYTQLIADVPNENSKEEKFVGGMPVQLEKSSIKQLVLQPNYIMTLKVDGERFLLFLASNGVIYFIDRSVNFYYIMNDSFTDRLAPLNMKPFLFDGELVQHKTFYEYLIFDVLFYDNKPLYDKIYSQRHNACIHAEKVFLGYFKHSTKQMIVTTKIWFPVELIASTPNIYNHVIKETNDPRPRESKLHADGIILQRYDTLYVPFGPWNKFGNIQFKWKPSDQLTIDFKIKIVSGTEWNLLTKTEQPFNVNQENGDPLPATCIPTDAQKLKYHEGEVIEFKFKPTGNPNKNLFIPMRSRNEKEANSLSTIMSTMNVIGNPFTLDIIKPALKYLDKKNDNLKSYLTIFSESDLILCSIDQFFSKYEIKEIKKVYTAFQTEEKSSELEFRLFKVGKKGKTLDKFTFYYLQDYFIKNFKSTNVETIDITENKTTKQTKFRSTYKNVLKDLMEGKSISNEYKNKIKNYTLEPKYKEKKFYNNLTFKLELAQEVQTNKVIKLRSLFAGNMVNNLIRLKNRLSFQVHEFWRVDLTNVLSAYTLETLKDKNETFEFECEYTGPKTLPFEDFIKSMSDLYILILSHSNYGDSN